MGLKFCLIGMTAISVIADSMLLPFYPQYFSERFGVSNPEHVGFYTAAICLTAMLALPFWARMVSSGGTLKLLLWTQIGAGLLCVACSLTNNLILFWILSLTMIIFKASYLLIYPYLMASENEANHSSTIGILSIVVHFGHIAGAVLGGFAIANWPLERAFLLMAVGDAIQIIVCAYIIYAGMDRPLTPTQPKLAIKTFSSIYPLGMLMLAFYFSEYQIVPFFVQYWQHIEPKHSVQLAAWIYAIPAGVGLIALWFNHRNQYANLASNPRFCLILGIAGLMLQGSGRPNWVLVGRILFGWASFQLTVRLDTLIFERSSPEAYASDYSKINIFQNIGVLLSYYSAGWLVSLHGLKTPFWLAAGGLLLTLLVYSLINFSALSINRRNSDVMP